jgi:hypothetical protein
MEENAGSKTAKEYLEMWVNGVHPVQLKNARITAMDADDLEGRVSRIESMIAFMSGDGSLSGQVWKMNWGYVIWGNDGFQLVQNENVQDCPEIGGASWLGNSILKICARALDRQPNGEVAVTEVALLQLKRETGSELNPGSDVGGLGGLFRGDFNTGAGSTDAAMKFAFEVSSKAHVHGVPFLAKDNVPQIPAPVEEPQHPHVPDSGGPMLDRDMRNDDALYDMFVHNPVAFRTMVQDWYRQANGHEIGEGHLHMLYFRALVERHRWVTMRNALSNLWPINA